MLNIDSSDHSLRAGTWIPNHIGILERTTCLGAREIILYNKITTTVMEALESDGYSSTVLVMEDHIFRRFFAVPHEAPEKE